MSMFTTAMFLELLGTVQKNAHQNSVDHGFWDESKRQFKLQDNTEAMVITNPWNFAEKIALIHSELSEAMEAHRAGPPEGFKAGETYWFSEDGNVYPTCENMPKGDSYKPEGIAIELADAVIRIMDLCEKMDIDLGRAILDKMDYNKSRPIKHGKAY